MYMGGHALKRRDRRHERRIGGTASYIAAARQLARVPEPHARKQNTIHKSMPPNRNRQAVKELHLDEYEL
jgi:hypothetical protein